MDPGTLRDQAWIGDAVLALYARRWLLKNPTPCGWTRQELFARMTTNGFLSGIGEPTAVEAEIGRIFEREGLSAAEAHIEATILPRFLKQLARAQQPGR